MITIFCLILGLPASASAQTSFGPESQISGAYPFAHSIAPADLDADGDMDLVSISGGYFASSQADWWENDGAVPPTWTRHTLIAPSLDGGWDVVCGDMDSDGDVDIACSWLTGVAWFQNDGAADPTFTRYTLSGTISWGHILDIADLNNDGHPDLLFASGGNNTVGWYQNGGGPQPTWTQRTISSQVRNAVAADAADVDADGDLDVLSSEGNGQRVLVWMNNGGSLPTWSQIQVGTCSWPQEARFADMNGDGDVDVVAAGELQDAIYWFENLGGGFQWSPHNVVLRDEPFWVSVADLDQDGDVDVLASLQSASTFEWYENDGAPSPVFSSHLIWSQATEPYCIDAADLDRDGDLDLIAASRGDSTLAWYENLLQRDPRLTKVGTCPGSVTLTVSGATPNATAVIVYGPSGSFTKPTPPCAGLILAISPPSVGPFLPTDSSGSASLTFRAPAAVCGQTVQAVDFARCQPSNPVTL